MKIKNLLTTLALMVVFLLVGSVGWAQIATHVVISEIYGGGGNAGAPYKNDYVELYNPTSSPVDISNWSIQYTSANGTTWGSNITSFGSGKTIPAKGYFLIKLAGGTNGVDLPSSDVNGTTNMGGTAGKVVLCNNSTAVSAVADPTDANIVDKVGFGTTATGFETAKAPAPSNTASIERKANATSTAVTLASGGADYLLGNGWDSNDNSADFVQQSSLSPQNSSSGIEPDTQAPQAIFSPADNSIDVPITSSVIITFDEAIRDVSTDVNFDNTTVDALITSFETVVGATAVTFDATIDATNKIITVTPSASLAGLTEYTLTLAPVEDASNNATVDQTITFTTIDPTAPTISNVAITEAAPYYAGDNITVTWTSANVDFVKIEAWVPATSVWEEIVASTDATDGSEVITIPADAYYSTDYKVRVSYVTTPSVNSESAIFTIIATPTINKIQSQTTDGDLSVYDGQIVRTSGIITFSGTGEYVIQDGDGSWNGIYVFDTAFDLTSVEGDNVTIQATVSKFNGVTQFASVTSLVVNSSGNPLPAITTLTTFQLTEEHEGVLVKVVNAAVTSVDAANGKFTINDGSGALIVDDNLYGNSEVGVVVGQEFTITGIGYYNNEYQILPRYAADMLSATDTVGSTVYSVSQGGLTITNVPYGTSLATFEGNITAAANATFETYQADGTSVAADLATGYKVIVTAQDGITKSTYVITINDPSNIATVTSGTYTVNSTDNTITNVPFSETLAAFEGNITPAAGATFETYMADGTTVATDLVTGYKLICTAEDGLTKKTYTITLNTEPNHEANITAYSVLGVNGTINAVDHTVAVTVPYGTTLTNLVATFTLSTNATAKVATVAQESGVTANDFTNPVVYSVTAEDASTTLTWTVTVTAQAPSTDATITSSVYTVNSTDNTITNVPYNETLATFEGNLTPAANATFETYREDGTTVATDLATGYKVIVTAQDATISKTYTVTLTTAPPMDLFISEYIEGSSNNKAIEIYNPTSSTIDLTQYSLKKGTNGADYSTNLPLTGLLEPGSVFVVAHTSAVDSIKNVANLIDAAGTIVYFNGDDPIGLFKGDDLIDVVGVVTGTDPGDGWDVAGTANATVNHTLVRKNNVIIGTNNWATSAGTDESTSQWVVYPQDRFAYLGWHISKSSANDILSFTLAEAYSDATINATNHTISIDVISGTALTALVPTITVSKSATINPASGAARDFTNPVVYTVKAQDGTTQDWTVTVTVLSTLSDKKDITSFSIPNQLSSNINASNGAVTVVMPYGTALTSLTPTIAVSAGASINPTSGTVQNFTNPVTYTVTAQDASTKTWTVTVSAQQVSLTSIHDIQYTTATSGDSPLKGQQVRTKGVVTAIKTGTSSFNMWLQDGTQPWSGIYVYGVDNANSVTVGDSVELLASVDEYYNLTQLKTITSFTNRGAGTLPAVASISVTNAKTEAYEGMLVKITNVECTVVDAGNGMFTVSDGTTTMNIDDFIYKYTPAQGTRYDITGVIDFSYSEFKVLPRDASDVSINTSATVNPFATFVAYPNPFTNEIRFEGADVARVTVTSIIGQVVLDRTIAGENYINTQELVRGIYLVKFTNKMGETTLRKLIKE